MKFLPLFLLLVSFVCADAQTYRAGGSSRPSFGASASEEDAEDSSVPGARSNIQTRTFSNYSSRQREWNKGVQTQAVRTNTAGSREFNDKAEEKAAQAVSAVQAATSAAAAAPKPAPGAASAPAAAPAAQPAAKPAASAPAAPKVNPNAVAAQDAKPAAAAQQPQLPSDPNAMLEQMKGMLDGFSGMGSGASGGGAPAGMNVPGMPDMSGLLKAASSGQQPGQK